MPAVLVHGVPDTAELWEPFRSRLARRDVVCPNLPGFASPAPDGFACTKDAYLDWLVGEQIVELMTPDATAAALRDARHPDPEGAASRVDDDMKHAVLALYRSAVDVRSEWSPPRDRPTPPAHVFWGAHDPYGPPEFGQAAADLAGAPLLVLDAGHWSIFERPDEVVPVLERLWQMA